MARAAFLDREEGGRVLARHLAKYAHRPDVIVLALPRGGVPVGYEVAQLLTVPFDVLLVRKLGVPGHEELAMGAIASGGVRVLNEEVVEALELTPDIIDMATREQLEELARRDAQFRHGRPFPSLEGRTVVVVDDGLATGSTMRAAVAALRVHAPARVVVGAPVGAPETCEMLSRVADEVVVPVQPESFRAVGLWYGNFPQTSGVEVQGFLARAAAEGLLPLGPPEATAP